MHSVRPLSLIQIIQTQRGTKTLPSKQLRSIQEWIEMKKYADAMTKRLLSTAIFILLLTELVVGQPNEIDSSEINTTHTYGSDQEFGPIESAISSENAFYTDRVLEPRSNLELYLSLGILVFGLILIIFTGIVAYRKNSGWDQEATRIFAVSIIVTAGLFLMTAGYSDQQVAPMFGLLGTIVGYLLGRSPPGEPVSK